MQKILFVCYGNTCRSPMAAGIAGRILQHFDIESAGVAPFPDQGAAKEGIAVMRERGIDISDHRTRSVDSLPLGTYDLIVAMDSLVHRHLRDRFHISPEKLIQWNIDDPVGKPPEAYRRAAKTIEEAMQALAERLKSDIE
jgi:protein-tyrosine phosphatase